MRCQWCGAVILHASREGRGLYESLGFKPTNEMRLIRPVALGDCGVAPVADADQVVLMFDADDAGAAPRRDFRRSGRKHTT